MTEQRPAVIPSTTLQAINDYFDRGLAQLQAEEVEDSKSFRLSVARTRFKEGFTDEAGFIEELRALRISESEIDQELVAGRLDYATDYTRDLITAYRDAVRAGNLSLDGYLEQLLALGIVTDRATAYYVRERVRIKPSEGASSAVVATPVYLTDAGKVQVDTIRRRRRKNLITRDQEIADLKDLGTPEELVTAWADNDDIRLEKSST